MFPQFARGGALVGAIRHVELGLVKLGVPGPRKELKPPAALAVPRIGSSVSSQPGLLQPASIHLKAISSDGFSRTIKGDHLGPDTVSPTCDLLNNHRRAQSKPQGHGGKLSLSQNQSYPGPSSAHRNG
ncbi:hypothetical protein PGTUg99_016261 [Puccinia graminis f. sp. tritici]|uniref:Uncharacterized protein n=1 Tax=Puccinia graminis f. sp. tritici TaxID=56615 RepID=A0A5B0NXR4_PUCGR|nr:hypothetical protein PGTUg99_016261 [Puccinia graminis f. sp. tritici]